ncbi:BON domain-containing protein [Nakamurella sp. PAMC28650]|uniref:BON domain-containing protein n=1 Tax=Nakamurella sp. PAMC28650 TaxID=2762325 RepID=UPI00164EAEB8|nr:BON domain-containing protein [Nakamurella sp. PAMC28650]QNK80286.1 BON domain-containing protein [Nakamurella sp. PAMC28650]
MTQVAKTSDTDLKNAVVIELSWLPSIDSSHIGVTADDGAITLTGQVHSYPEKVAAGKAALRVKGVHALAQEISVHTKWTTRTDTDIAREAGEALERAVNVPDTIKATVAARVITLTGEATWHYQSTAAAWAVHTIKGVVGVHDRVQIRSGAVLANVKASIQAALVRNARFEGDYITVMTDSGGGITLEGVVRSPGERHQAELVAWSAPGITSITNNLTIQY